tara:strand:- start:499 stop:1161 length:663 start_codon:yes stop_codon:yes gene_type:complete
MFFDKYPEVYESDVSADPERLEYRYNLLIKQHQEYIKDQHFIDLGAHDGRFSLAALDNGASHVTLVEGRKDSCDRSVELLKKYHPNKFTVIHYDLRGGFIPIKQADFVFCAGLLYHVIDPYHILKCIKLLKPKTILVDSTVDADMEDQPYLKLLSEEPTDNTGNVLTNDLVVWPSKIALEGMYDFLNWDFTLIDPYSIQTAIPQYRKRERLAWLIKPRYN